MRILGIETSCDETGIAVYDDEKGLLSHELYSQVKLHADYGGVVPELASRDHVRKIIPLIEKAMEDANTKPSEIDGVAFTQGPGLVGALCRIFSRPFAGLRMERTCGGCSPHGRAFVSAHA